MRLIKCHIENFGKLNDFEFNFSEGFNSIKEENGWGKSTFAIFLKAMFYGLPSTTKRNLDENERKKYTPWQGGNFGGNIEFEINSKQYRIERFFGKNNSEDTFLIIDLATGKKSNDYSENIGEEVFGLDEEAFERSSFIPQKILNSSINESISNKLTNLIQGTTDTYNYEESQNILNKKRITLYNTRGSGLIQEVENNIEDIIGKINELNTRAISIDVIQKQVDIYDKEIVDLLKEQNEIKSQIREYSKVQQKVANKDLFDVLNNEIDLTKRAIEKKEEVINDIDTSLTEVAAYIELSKGVSINENKLQLIQGNNYLKERYNKLVEYFGNDINVPTIEETKEVSEDIVQYNNLKGQFGTNQTEQPMNYISGKKEKLSILLAAISIVSLILGVVLLKSTLTFAIVLFIIGGILLLSAAFTYLVNMINVKTNKANNIDFVQIQKNQEEGLRLQKKIESFISKFEDIDAEYGVLISNIIFNIKEFENIKQQISINTENSNELSNLIKEDKCKIEKYLSKFNIEEKGSLLDRLTFLRQTIIEIANLKEKIKEKRQELENFKKEKNFYVNEEQITNVDINELQAKETEYQNKIDEYKEYKSSCVVQINNIREDISVLDDLENEKEILENNLKLLNKELNAIKNAKKFLEIANESLSAKFLEPMKNGLNKYLKLITGKDFKNLQLDTDFNISFEEFGKYRAVDYYSKGYRTTIDLCMRLALIDSLFDKEKPFIVLDDPFVNMDEEKVKNAKQFLQELSKTYQLIYFSCHESRS